MTIKRKMTTSEIDELIARQTAHRETQFMALERLLPLANLHDGLLGDRILALPDNVLPGALICMSALGWLTPAF